MIPTPTEATIAPNAPCTPTARHGLLLVCAFGATTGQARETVALIGDSHAAHWRGALEVVAQARRWRGLSVTRSSCPFAMAVPATLAPSLRDQCRRWNSSVRGWLSAHPRIHTIFLSADARTVFAGSAEDSFRAVLRTLPRSVKQVFVLRDTPQISAPQAGCVDDAIAHRRPAGERCAQSRSSNLPRDPLVGAAANQRRAHIIDLTRHACDRSRCLAVVGGVLVRKDGTHMTSLFSTTLGPYVLRAVHRVLTPPRTRAG